MHDQIVPGFSTANPSCKDWNKGVKTSPEGTNAHQNMNLDINKLKANDINLKINQHNLNTNLGTWTNFDALEDLILATTDAEANGTTFGIIIYLLQDHQIHQINLKIIFMIIMNYYN